MKKILILTLFLILLTSMVSAVCTVNFDKLSYFYGETVVAEMTCGSGDEKKEPYTLEWRDEAGSIIQTDNGTTPNAVGSLFTETYNIPISSSITNINATLNGLNLEGFDSANVSDSGNTTLILTNFTSSGVGLIGKLASIQFKVINGGNRLVSNAICSATITDSIGGSPITEITDKVVFDGIGHLTVQLDNKVFSEDKTYLTKISCMCIEGTERQCFNEYLELVGNRVTSANAALVVGKWISEVTTLTDKTSYTLSDEYIDVCVELNNTNDFRIPVDIYYSYRCGGNNNDTNRVLIDTHREYRGISGNTTQNQCARLKIINVPEIQNQVNDCYASTDVGVVFGDTTGLFPVTYSTTSQNFTITSTSSYYLEEDNMLSIIIGLGIISVVLLWFALSLGEEHGLLKLLLSISSITVLILIPSQLSGANTSTILFKTILVIFKTFWFYVGGYFVYWLFKKYLNRTVEELE